MNKETHEVSPIVTVKKPTDIETAIKKWEQNYSSMELPRWET